MNPWANNVASVTPTPKPGSPLAATTTTYAYDPAYNKTSGNPQTVIADSGPRRISMPPRATPTTAWARSPR